MFLTSFHAYADARSILYVIEFLLVAVGTLNVVLRALDVVVLFGAGLVDVFLGVPLDDETS